MSWVMDCLDVFLISSKGGIKKRAVATGYKSNWVASIYIPANKELCLWLITHALHMICLEICEADVCSHITAPGKLDGIGLLGRNIQKDCLNNAILSSVLYFLALDRIICHQSWLGLMHCYLKSEETWDFWGTAIDFSLKE